MTSNREMRRQQARSKPSTRPPGKGPSLRASLAPAPGAPRSRGSVLRPNWIKDIVSELRKVQWPTRAEAWNLTLVVILVSVVVGAALGGLDSAFGWFMQNTILR